jgi:hypothetical protein
MPRQNTHHKKLHAVMVSSRDYSKKDKNTFQVGCDTIKPSFQNRQNFKSTVKNKLAYNQIPL